VNQEGIPEDVTVMQALGMGLDERAEECVKKWRFNPGTKDGKPVKVRARVEVSFQMQKAPY
jgi:TonB family protein